MKNFYNLSVVVILFLFSGISLAQVPTYNLRAMNFVNVSINFPNDAIEFDIYIEHTNPPTVFEYAIGQYFILLNSTAELSRGILQTLT